LIEIESAEDAEVIHSEISSLRAQTDFHQISTAAQSRQSNRSCPVPGYRNGMGKLYMLERGNPVCLKQSHGGLSHRFEAQHSR
jgi:hypothetical protein